MLRPLGYCAPVADDLRALYFLPGYKGKELNLSLLFSLKHRRVVGTNARLCHADLIVGEFYDLCHLLPGLLFDFALKHVSGTNKER